MEPQTNPSSPKPNKKKENGKDKSKQVRRGGKKEKKEESRTKKKTTFPDLNNKLITRSQLTIQSIPLIWDQLESCLKNIIEKRKGNLVKMHIKKRVHKIA